MSLTTAYIPTSIQDASGRQMALQFEQSGADALTVPAAGFTNGRDLIIKGKFSRVAFEISSTVQALDAVKVQAQIHPNGQWFDWVSSAELHAGTAISGRLVLVIVDPTTLAAGSSAQFIIDTTGLHAVRLSLSAAVNNAIVSRGGFGFFWGGGGGGGGGSGNVAGPGSSNDGDVAVFSGATGKILKDNIVNISDSGVVTGVTEFDLDGFYAQIIKQHFVGGGGGTYADVSLNADMGFLGVSPYFHVFYTGVDTQINAQGTLKTPNSVKVGGDLTVDGSLIVFGGVSYYTLTMAGNATVSNTNTGDQTITLTGDVTGSGTGSFAATIANSAVTLAKMANMATASLLGRNTAGTGAPEVLSAATARSLLGLSTSSVVIFGGLGLGTASSPATMMELGGTATTLGLKLTSSNTKGYAICFGSSVPAWVDTTSPNARVDSSGDFVFNSGSGGDLYFNYDLRSSRSNYFDGTNVFNSFDNTKTSIFYGVTTIQRDATIGSDATAPFIVANNTHPTYNVIMGYDATADVGYLQTLHAGVSYSNFVMQRNGGNVAIGSTTATARLHLAAGTATAGTAPLKFTSGTNLSTAAAGAMEYDGTNLFFTRTGTTRESVFVGVSGAAAPTTAAGSSFSNYYGANSTNVLGTPNSWASVVVGGTTYKLPLYT